jgi:putative nucleotidyltransferase with HDIG domain
MNHLSLVSESASRARFISRHFANAFKVDIISPSELAGANPGRFVFCDIDLDGPSVPTVKLWLTSCAEDAKIIVAVDRGSHAQATRALGLGATDLELRPIEAQSVLAKLLGDIENGGRGQIPGATSGILDGLEALQNVFAFARLGKPLDTNVLDTAAETIVCDIKKEGFGRWLQTIRQHHSQTYQHCLIVTGVAVTFARHLGFSNADQQKIATAGLLHDVGKARIPIAILEKPGPLDADELAVMRQHPLHGYDALRRMPDLDARMLDIVLHHHEYLDGTGYPHGLSAKDLPDLVRMMTIADIYGALLERRSYKAPFTPEAAYKVIADMVSRLDRHLVRAFEPIASGKAA